MAIMYIREYGLLLLEKVLKLSWEEDNEHQCLMIKVLFYDFIIICVPI